MNGSGLWEGQLQNEAKSVCMSNSIECKIMAPLLQINLQMNPLVHIPEAHLLSSD